MFVLGILVGRGTAPVKFDIDKLNKELAELKQKDIKEQMERLKVDAENVKPKTDLEFYEELKKNPQPVTKKIQKEPGPSQSQTKEKAVRPSSEKRPAEKAAASKPPASAKVKPAQKQPQTATGKTVTEKTLTIQAASLKEMQDAENLVAKLKSKGYPAYKSIGMVPEKGIWFRVRIGEYSNPEDAAATLQRLKKDGFEPILVRK
jgi:cell division protein FtsN